MRTRVMQQGILVTGADSRQAAQDPGALTTRVVQVSMPEFLRIKGVVKKRWRVFGILRRNDVDDSVCASFFEEGSHDNTGVRGRTSLRTLEG